MTSDEYGILSGQLATVTGEVRVLSDKLGDLRESQTRAEEQRATTNATLVRLESGQAAIVARLDAGRRWTAPEIAGAGTLVTAARLLRIHRARQIFQVWPADRCS